MEVELGTLRENRAGGTGKESAAWGIWGVVQELGKGSLWELRLGLWLCVWMWGRIQVKEESQHTPKAQPKWWEELLGGGTRGSQVLLREAQC